MAAEVRKERTRESFHRGAASTHFGELQLELIRGEGSGVLLAKRGVGVVGTTSSEVPVSTAYPYFWAPFVLVGDGK